MQEIPVQKILPDENQPRKYFAADKMYQIKKSIEKHGIISPLTVEDIGGGKYLLIDGERRFRAAMDLGLKKVPCMVEEPRNEVDRAIRQFQIQEFHEEWTPIEKAMSILSLSKALGKDMRDTCKILNVGSRETARYVAFAELADKESYIRNEVPLDWAQQFHALKASVRRTYINDLEQEFTRTDEKKLEHRLTDMIKQGQLTKRSQALRLTDAFRKNPKLIKKFMENKKTTPDGLFTEAKAAGAYHLRNAIYNARYIAAHGSAFLKTKDVKITPEQLHILTRGAEVLKKVINLA